LDITVYCDQEVTLTAVPKVDPARQFITNFLRWEGGPCNGSTNKTCKFTVTGNATVTGIFLGHPI
jgi:hypothetical protein